MNSSVILFVSSSLVDGNALWVFIYSDSPNIAMVGSMNLAEVHGNRTHPPARHRRTGFEDQEAHQDPGTSVFI